VNTLEKCALCLRSLFVVLKTHNCRLRQVAEQREWVATAKRVRRSFDLDQTFYEGRVPSHRPTAVLITCMSEGLGGPTVILIPRGWGRLGNSSVGTASSLASRVGKNGGRHDLDASFSKGVEHISSQFSVGVEDAKEWRVGAGKVRKAYHQGE
jgi:hypothetical protein